MNCRWTPVMEFDDDIAWDTGCDETFAFIDGGPTENRVKFCPYCGKPLEIQEMESQP